MKTSTWLWCAGICLSSLQPLFGQKYKTGKLEKPIVCYSSEGDHEFYLPPPEAYRLVKSGARVKTASVTVAYGPGFPADAKNAFQTAASIWGSLIYSPVTIRIRVDWEPSDNPGELAAAIYTYVYPNFEGAQKLDTYYPVALAERITGEELNPSDEPDIYVSFNSNRSWHFDPNTAPPSGKFDMVSVALHEIGHGLGFSASYVKSQTSSVIYYGHGAPLVYDVFLQNGSGINLAESYALPTSGIFNELHTDNLYIKTPVAGTRKIYAPSVYSRGSSISHLDDATYDGTNDALMTHAINPVERIHDPGIALTILEDLGWESMNIDHLPVHNTEDVAGPYPVTVKIFEGNDGFDPASLIMRYTTSGVTYTDVPLLPTGNSNEFGGEITSLGVGTYSYYIIANDNAGRVYSNPGKIVRNGSPQVRGHHYFEVGPDNEDPTIEHTPRPFLITAETEFVVNAKIEDNIGIESAVVSYSINDVQQPDEPMALLEPARDAIFSSTITFASPLQDGDVVKYTITAVDSSSNQNSTVAPASGTYTVNVVGLFVTQDYYQNDFNDASNDFFGSGFSIITPEGFSDGALHSDHPYDEGVLHPNLEWELIYQLRVPIRVAAQDALISFDEIVLVEPGTDESFGSEDFFDFVVVEGSSDGGLTWVPVADGYDSRAYGPWLTKYNSSTSGNNSTAKGDPSLYVPREFDLHNKFETGDEVVIRFRLYSDPYAAGWGWAIDNLKIQIDQKPPLVMHDHHDYILDTLQYLPIKTFATDASGVKQLAVEYYVNEAVPETIGFVLESFASSYTLNLDVSALNVGDVIHYRIIAVDSADLTGYFPASGAFINVPIIEYGSPVAGYATSFDDGLDDFVGNFYSIVELSGFKNNAIHSTHNYPNGQGFTGSSEFVYTLTKPITISADNPYMRFDQVVLVEGHPTTAAFGTDEFNDYAVVEGSKDGGLTWMPLEDGYDAKSDASWNTMFNNGSSGYSTVLRTRTINLLTSGNFVHGDNVLFRFRLHANSSINGWGWVIDNLYIQDAITGIEAGPDVVVDIYPVPFGNSLAIESRSQGISRITLTDAQGQIHYSGHTAGPGRHTIDTSAIAPGVYFIRIFDGRSIEVRKVLKGL